MFKIMRSSTYRNLKRDENTVKAQQEVINWFQEFLTSGKGSIYTEPVYMGDHASVSNCLFLGDPVGVSMSSKYNAPNPSP